MVARVTIQLLHNRFPEIVRKLPMETSQVVRTAAFQIEANAKSSMSGVGSPSPPGGPPAIVTSNLVNSIYTDAKLGKTTASVNVGAEYGVYLEFGTIYMEPRPFMKPAAEKVKPAFEAAMKQLLERL